MKVQTKAAPHLFLDEVHLHALDGGQPDLRLPGKFGGLVARAVRVRTKAAVRPLCPLGGKQRDIDVLADVLDVGRALKHF